MTIPARVLALALAIACLHAATVQAHHRQTPPLVQITTDGDNTLPRVPCKGGTLAFAAGAPGAKQLYAVKIRTPSVVTPLTSTGDNDHPAISQSGQVVAWDVAATGGGRQVAMSARGPVPIVLGESAATTANPAVDLAGRRVVFESDGNADGATVPGVARIFLRDNKGVVRRLSPGDGPSHNPTMGRDEQVIAFDSTSDIVTGADTGIPQVWLANARLGTLRRLTAGAGASQFPLVGNDSRAIVFQSTAALAGDGADTGVPQVFLYDVRTGNYAQVTNDPAGCTLPAVQLTLAVDSTAHEWRVTYTCAGVAYLYEMRSDRRWRLPVADGDVTRVVPEMDNHFLVLTTTADLLAGSGLLTGHQIFIWNVFKKPVEPVSGPAATWFPVRGMPTAPHR